jgi:serine/threonine protein phosphatase PrpC
MNPTATVPPQVMQRPADEELDMFGATHQGRVRRDNQDHFFVATVHPQLALHGTSLPETDALPLRGTRLATVLLVADGVGGAAEGALAAQVATESVARYVSHSLRSYHAAGTHDDQFLGALREAALQAHDAVRAEAASRPVQSTMATTLTLSVVVYPWAYVVQVGDSRAYIYSQGVLQQITRDQTMAQALVDEGAMKAADMKRSPLNNMLASAVGTEAKPVVSRVSVANRGCVLLLCSDGLTKHVSNEEIERRCGAMTSARQLAEDLIQLALERGGSDNVTVVVARAPLKPAPA